jgi:hypothetical protein
MRSSVAASTLSGIVMRMKKPAPSTLCRFPIRRITNFSHTLAPRTDSAMTKAMMKRRTAGVQVVPRADSECRGDKRGA